MRAFFAAAIALLLAFPAFASDVQEGGSDSGSADGGNESNGAESAQRLPSFFVMTEDGRRFTKDEIADIDAQTLKCVTALDEAYPDLSKGAKSGDGRAAFLLYRHQIRCATRLLDPLIVRPAVPIPE